MSIAETYAHNKKALKGLKISRGWWRKFMERQKGLSLRQGDNTSHIRIDAINQETI